MTQANLMKNSGMQANISKKTMYVSGHVQVRLYATPAKVLQSNCIKYLANKLDVTKRKTIR